MKALVVDDSSTMRIYLRTILKSLGFEVSEARNGSSGLELLQNGPQPDVALIDWNMPEMDGLELLQEIRKQSAFNNMTVVMVTAESDVSRIALALESGANEYLMKPLTPEIVASKLQMLGF